MRQVKTWFAGVTVAVLVLALAPAVLAGPIASAAGLGLPSFSISEFSQGITAGSEPRGIALAADNALWFVEELEVGRGRGSTAAWLAQKVGPNGHLTVHG
jgi:streptogramin lyase